MKIVVECYGASQRWCGAVERSVEIGPAGTVSDALDQLALRYPEFSLRRTSVVVAIGDAVISTSTALTDGMRIALIPPVSGG